MPSPSPRTPGFKQAIAKAPKLGPEHNPWFWNPNRVGARSHPAWFQRYLDEVGPDLAVVWNPIRERWQAFCRAPRIDHPVCQGWRLLFIHSDVDGSYMPLDERLVARIFAASAMSSGGAVKYFERIAAEYARDEAAKEKRLQQEAIDQAMPYYEHSQIKNIGKGNKFSTYHA